jgi:hypothetical protein
LISFFFLNFMQSLGNVERTAGQILIERFYSAFQQGDYATMQALYHDRATFSDPVFGTLKADQARAMWEMLIKSGKELRIVYHHVEADRIQGSCSWEAWYKFSRTNRPVHNVIRASFAFDEGKIFRHADNFSFWKWSRQALGVTGWRLGGTSALQKKVSLSAQENLARFIGGR